jgi:hypothetical protein
MRLLQGKGVLEDNPLSTRRLTGRHRTCRVYVQMTRQDIWDRTQWHQPGPRISELAGGSRIGALWSETGIHQATGGNRQALDVSWFDRAAVGVGVRSWWVTTDDDVP